MSKRGKSLRNNERNTVTQRTVKQWDFSLCDSVNFYGIENGGGWLVELGMFCPPWLAISLGSLMVKEIICNLRKLWLGRLWLISCFPFPQEFLSDQVTPGLPGLTDLGVDPSSLENIAISVLRRHRDVFFFDDAIDSDAPCRPTSAYAAQWKVGIPK